MPEAMSATDRLSGLDEAFLALDTARSPMHVGWTIRFGGTPPTLAALRRHLDRRLHLVPRFRRRVVAPPFGLGDARWADDPGFDVARHVHAVTLPPPGGAAELRELAGVLLAAPLDPARPLWQVHLVRGLHHGGFALLGQVHHALVDGIAALDLAMLLFDVTPEPQPPTEPPPSWRPAPEPTPIELAGVSVAEAAADGVKLAASSLGALAHPGRALGAVRDAAEGVGEVAWAMLNPAPTTPLNVEIGPHRRFVGVRFALDDFRAVKRTFGGTVNDVVLTVVTAALRAWLQGRGVRTAGLELRALVPVSIRDRSERGTTGNRLAAMRGPLPVYVADPLERLRTVRQAMQDLKGSKQAIGAEVLAGVQAFVPPNVMAQAARITFSTRLFNLLVTNVPGPQFPLYVQGRELVDAFPVAFLAEDHALSIAAFSYNGRVNFGLLGDYDALPDLDVIGRHLEDAVAELVALAGERGDVDADAPPRAATA